MRTSTKRAFLHVLKQGISCVTNTACRCSVVSLSNEVYIYEMCCLGVGRRIDGEKGVIHNDGVEITRRLTSERSRRRGAPNDDGKTSKEAIAVDGPADVLGGAVGILSARRTLDRPTRRIAPARRRIQPADTTVFTVEPRATKPGCTDCGSQTLTAV